MLRILINVLFLLLVPVVCVATDPSYVLNTINEARLNPEDYGAEISEVDLSGLRLEPLSLDLDLSEAAEARAKELMQGLRAGTVDLDDAFDRSDVEQFGYEALLVKEVLAGIATPESMLLPYDRAVGVMTDGMIRDALLGRVDSMPLFEYFFEDIGIAVAGGSVVFQGERYNVYVMVLLLGCREPEKPAIYGHVFADQNEDSLYEPGEGLGGRILAVEGPLVPAFDPDNQPPLRQCISGVDGFYKVEVDEVGWYRVWFLDELAGAINSVVVRVDGPNLLDLRMN